MVANLAKNKKLKTRKVLKKAKGWESIGSGDQVALFKSERGSFFAVMGSTKFYIRPAKGIVRKKKLKIMDLDDGTEMQMRCASNFMS